MPLRIADKDVATLNMAMTLFLAPFSSDSGDERRQEVYKSFDAALSTSGLTLEPAWSTSISARISGARQKHALLALLNEMPVGLLIVDGSGAVLSENISAGCLFDADPERERLRAKVTRIAEQLAGSSTLAGNDRVSGELVHEEVRTRVSRYHIMATFLGASLFGASGIVVALIERLVARPLDAHQLSSRFHLTSREIETAHLLERGHSTRRIAGFLGISINTARRHVEHVLSKLDVHSRSAVASRLAGE